MTWLRENILSWTELLAVKILKSGPVPKHAAFIMDGNRRFAKKKQMAIIEGHTDGFHTMTDMMQWCLLLGIREMTVFVFGIENFRRSLQEVDDLMELFVQKLRDLLSDGKEMMERGVCFRVMGDLSLLPAELRHVLAEVVLMTKDNNNAFFNMAFAYTSKNEVAHTVKNVLEGIENGDIRLDDISEELISECLYTNQSPEPDLLIRTSGELRLSNFLMWQTSSCCIYFTKVLWPEFGIWNMLAAVFYYQRCYPDLKFMRQRQKPNLAASNNRVYPFVNNLQEKRESMIEKNRMELANTC